jgi:hypothetical protein
MNKTAVTVGAVAIALIAAGTIYAMQNKSASTSADAALNNGPPSSTSTGTHSSGGLGDSRLVVPAGTPLRIKLATSLSTKTSVQGDTFEATIASPVSVGGHVAIPEGASVSGRVILVQQPGKASGRGQMQLSYDKVSFGGHAYDLATRSQVYESKSGTKKDVEMIGGGAVAGGIVGAILGGKGSVGKGAAVGAAAGTGTALMTRGPQLELGAGTVLNAELGGELRVRRS